MQYFRVFQIRVLAKEPVCGEDAEAKRFVEILINFIGKDKFTDIISQQGKRRTRNVNTKIKTFTLRSKRIGNSLPEDIKKARNLIYLFQKFGTKWLEL